MIAGILVDVACDLARVPKAHKVVGDPIIYISHKLAVVAAHRA